MYHEWYAKRIKAAKARLRRIKILQHKRRMKLLHTNSRLSSLTKKRTPLVDITSPFLNQQPNFHDSSANLTSSSNVAHYKSTHTSGLNLQNLHINLAKKFEAVKTNLIQNDQNPPSDSNDDVVIAKRKLPEISTHDQSDSNSDTSSNFSNDSFDSDTNSDSDDSDNEEIDIATNSTSAQEVAALIVGDIDEGYTRDIIIQEQSGELSRIDEFHTAYLGYQYPLLFPFGEDGYRRGTLHKEKEGVVITKRNRLTIMDWLSFCIQSRKFEAQTLLRSKRLFQQFLVDGFTMMESERLSWVRNNQSTLRVGKYQKLNDNEGNQDKNGKRVVLPSTFVGSKRYMDQLYFDGMAISASSRAILASTIQVVEEINNYVLSLIPGEATDYYSCDSIDQSDVNDCEIFNTLTPEFLNSLRTSGLPNHKISLKIGTPIMLMRNLDQAEGLLLIYFEYYGHGLFGVLATGDRENLDEIPAFHSRSENQHSTAIFDVKLTGQHFDAPKLPLQLDFAEFLHQFLHEGIVLCGFNGVSRRIGVFNFADWEEFSKNQNFKAGDLIRFKFEKKNETTVSNRCHVFRIYA
ncbi:hypothetical protein QL285_037001 [Trifolium repens]|nr:hypothetical protein QL285_037001 [Trifolium repens]